MARAIIHQMDPVHPNVKRLKSVVDLLADGDVIIYPTDTVYGLGCDIRSKKGIDKLRSLKGVDDKHLMSFICADLSQAAQFVNIDNSAFALLRRILPG
ncbi:Sua5/YciO/YrdC/YwlC family protein, partial [Myxococcota bacterium]|nr:Sua5/YciO/YrdC/YwlC family protein [Myxococcota bacterium]